MNNRVPFNPLEAHHLYWGALLCGLSIFLCIRYWDREHHVWKNKWAPPVVAFCGFTGMVLIGDDSCQHFINGSSPVHDLFVFVWSSIFGSWWPFGSI